MARWLNGYIGLNTHGHGLESIHAGFISSFNFFAHSIHEITLWAMALKDIEASEYYSSPSVSLQMKNVHVDPSWLYTSP